MGILIPIRIRREVFGTILNRTRPSGFSFKVTDGPLSRPGLADRKKKKNRKAVKASRQKNRG